MYDLNRTYFGDTKERPVHAGAAINEEGGLLVYASNGAGSIDVQPCTSGAGQRIAGWAITDAMKVVTETVVETVTVPAAGGAVNLSHTNIVAASERVVASTTGVLSETCPTPGSGAYCIVDATGVITFHVDQAGQTVTVSYRYNLTMFDILNKYHERSINNRAQDYFSSVSVGCLEGEIFTSMYDTSVAWTILAPVYPGAGGLVTTTAGGATAIGFVSQVPGVTDALVGIKYAFPTV